MASLIVGTVVAVVAGVAFGLLAHYTGYFEASWSSCAIGGSVFVTCEIAVVAS